MQPLPADQEQAFRRGWQRFVQLMRDAYPDRPEAFFQIVRMGALQIGVGSGLEAKILIRIAGPTAAPEDDVILEVRPTRTSDGTECVSRPTHGGSMQVMMFEALLGPRLPEVVGFLPREGAREAPELWVQSWDPGYRELSIANLQSQTELNELALDAATQLAGYFWTTFPEPLRRASAIRAATRVRNDRHACPTGGARVCRRNDHRVGAFSTRAEINAAPRRGTPSPPRSQSLNFTRILCVLGELCVDREEVLLRPKRLQHIDPRRTRGGRQRRNHRGGNQHCRRANHRQRARQLHVWNKPGSQTCQCEARPQRRSRLRSTR